jgi:hypothetical protein
MLEKSGFKRQSLLSGNCGQRSLIHALYLLSIHISIGQAYKATGLTRIQVVRSGTDDVNLIRGIRKCGCKPLPHLLHDGKKAERQIRHYLSRGIPVIISVSDAEHWMVLSGVDSRSRYSWIDSTDQRLIGKNAWRTVATWMRYEEEETENYYFIGVKPGKGKGYSDRKCC